MNFKEYYTKILNEETDIISVKAKLDAKKRGLKHQSHNIWKDKGGQEYKWNKVLKRFEKIEGSKEEKHNEDIDLKKLNNDLYSEERILRKKFIAASDNIITIKAAKNIAKKYKINYKDILKNITPNNNLSGDKTWDKNGNIIKT